MEVDEKITSYGANDAHWLPSFRQFCEVTANPLLEFNVLIFNKPFLELIQNQDPCCWFYLARQRSQFADQPIRRRKRVGGFAFEFAGTANIRHFETQFQQGTRYLAAQERSLPAA